MPAQAGRKSVRFSGIYLSANYFLKCLTPPNLLIVFPLYRGWLPLRFTEFGGRVLWRLSKIQEFEDKPQKQGVAGQGLCDYLGPTGPAPRPLGGLQSMLFFQADGQAPLGPLGGPLDDLPAQGLPLSNYLRGHTWPR